MNFNEFVSEVKDNIKLFLPEEYENVEVSTMECQQLNRAYTGLMVRKEGEMLLPRRSILISCMKHIKHSLA